MNITNKAIVKFTEHSILAMIKEFQSGPYRFMYESDIQFSLASKMRSAIPEVIKVKGTGHPLAEYELAIVNTEYGSRVDISCLDVEQNAVIPPTHKGRDIHVYQQPLLVGIEIKYLKLGDTFGFQKCIDDDKKLTKLNVPHRYVLGFIQNEQAVDLFFSGGDSSYQLTEIDFEELGPIGEFIVISPSRIWKVELR